MKRCGRCRESKETSEFHNDSARLDGLKPWCKDCTRSNNRDRYRRIKESMSDEEFKTERRRINLQRHGLTPEEYGSLLEAQGGVCAICGGSPAVWPEVLVVDHDHESGEIRGLLCQQCNAGLGMFRDNIASLFRAADYLLLVRRVDA